MNPTTFPATRFPAPITRAKAIGGFMMSETRYDSGATLTTHAHENACFVVVIRGTFADRCGRIERTASPGMLIVRPAGEPHSNQFSRTGGQCLNVELPPQWLAHVREHTRALDTPAAFTGSTFDLLGRRLHDELRSDDDVSALAVESLVLGLLTDADRASRRAPHVPPRWLKRAKDLIESRATERLTLAMIAAEVGVHPIHLAFAFQRFFGSSIGEFMRQRRVAYACRRLAETDLPLSDIALEAGFSDQSHFGRTFKRVMHSTPGRYRMSSR